MNAIVEHTPVTRWGNDEFHSKVSINELNIHFINCIYMINNSKNEVELRNQMKTFSILVPEFTQNFNYGFGSYHMWVHQKGKENVQNPDRCIFVEFNN